MGCDKISKQPLRILENFNPRTHVGCDEPASATSSGRWNFNPRTHVGCDLWFSIHHNAAEVISIHAPTWGATQRPGGHHFRGEISIHAPTWGATCSPDWPPSCLTFQSTHPRGVRLGASQPFVSLVKFQSTHPRGVRLQLGFAILLMVFKFQSTHPRGVRR